MHRHHHHHSHWPQFFGGPRKGFGRGRFGGWFADGGELGGRGFGMGRKLASGDLQLLILELLADKPRHGYEIIKALEERSKGFYTPSPGMVYPALTYLEEIGYATVEADGSRKLYHITASGQAQLDENRDVVDSMFAQFERVGEKMDRMRRAFSGDESARAEQEDLSSGRRGSNAMQRARRELKSALHAAVDTPDRK